jgi:hypothetical protein
MRDNRCVRLLAYVTGLVNQRLLLQCEYLIAENRILRSHASGMPRLSDPERCTLAEIGKRPGPPRCRLGDAAARGDSPVSIERIVHKPGLREALLKMRRPQWHRDITRPGLSCCHYPFGQPPAQPPKGPALMDIRIFIEISSLGLLNVTVRGSGGIRIV